MKIYTAIKVMCLKTPVLVANNKEVKYAKRRLYLRWKFAFSLKPIRGMFGQQKLVDILNYLLGSKHCSYSVYCCCYFCCLDIEATIILDLCRLTILKQKGY